MKFKHQILAKMYFLRQKIMCLRVIYKKKYETFFASLKSLKKGIGSGSISQRYGIRTKMSRIPNTGVNYMNWPNYYFIHRQSGFFLYRKLVGRISNDEFDAPGWWMTSSGGATRLILQGRIRWPALLYTCLSYSPSIYCIFVFACHPAITSQRLFLWQFHYPDCRCRSYSTLTGWYSNRWKLFFLQIQKEH